MRLKKEILGGSIAIGQEKETELVQGSDSNILEIRSEDLVTLLQD